MDEINKVDEFFKSLSELSLKRQERIKSLELIKIWKFLSPEKKQEFAERIIGLAEGYERSQIQENLKVECERKGHIYGKWNKSSYNGEDYWYRVCKKCGKYDQTYNEPKNDNPKKRLFRIKKPF